MTLFADLKKAIGTEWTDYTEHEFVRKLGEGTLPLPVFQDYLVQDYHFLVRLPVRTALLIKDGGLPMYQLLHHYPYLKFHLESLQSSKVPPVIYLKQL